MFKNYVKEGLQKCLYRHAGENWHPVINCFDWIPPGESRDHAGMTHCQKMILVQSFLKLQQVRLPYDGKSITVFHIKNYFYQLVTLIK